MGKKGNPFNHICKDVHEAAQHWVREWVKLFEKRFFFFVTTVGMWFRMDGNLTLSDLELLSPALAPRAGHAHIDPP